MSIILRPIEKAKRLAFIPAMVSLAVVETIAKYGVTGRIKWPNDVMVEDKKLAGILCESSILGARFQWIIVGIGVNVNNPPPRLPSLNSNYEAISMIQITRKETNLSSLAESIRSSVIRDYNDLQSAGETGMLEQYNVQQTLRNCYVRISLPDQILSGVAGQVDAEGRLSLETPDGSTHKIRSENVLLIETV